MEGSERGMEEEEGEEGGDDDDDAGDRGPWTGRPTGEVGDSTSNLQAQHVTLKLPVSIRVPVTPPCCTRLTLSQPCLIRATGIANIQVFRG